MFQTLALLLAITTFSWAGPPPPFREPPRYEIAPENQMQMCCKCCPFDKFGQTGEPCLPIPGPKCNAMGWGCFGYTFCPK